MTAAEFRKNIYGGDRRCKSLAIIDTGTKELAGYCSLGLFRLIPAYRSTARISIYLRPEYTGKGIGRMAIARLEKAARKGKFHAIIASISGENKPSIKLFERNGYKRAARLKEIARKFNRYIDLLQYEKILK